MATYLQGVNDYISQVQPSAPNLAFDAQILQSKQAKYDANHKKVSELYGSLLNSAMTRTDNIQARDEFFKIINTDIQKMGSLDFSLDANVDAAANVFQSIYSNKSIVKDMLWTRDFNDQVQVGESFKNCVDPEACGGQWWEEGDKYMAYKRQEFKNASAAEAMGMEAPQYIPRNNVMTEAIKKLKDSGLSFELDQDTGKYIITTKNGENIISPLTQLFNQTIGQDPKFALMYNVQAYVERNDWAYNKVNTGEYNTINDAQMAYFQKINTDNQKKLDHTANLLNVDRGYLNEKIQEQETLFKNGAFSTNSEDYANLLNLKELHENSKNAENYVNQLKTVSQNANQNLAIRTMGELIDQQNAFLRFDSDIHSVATTLAFKDFKQSMKENDFALKALDHQFKLSQMSQQHKYNLIEDSEKSKHALELAELKANSKNDISLDDTTKLTIKKGYVESYNPSYAARAAWAKATNSSTIESEEDMNKKLKEWEKNGKTVEIERWNKIKKAAEIKQIKLKQDANLAAYKAGEVLPYREAVTLNDLESDDLKNWNLGNDVSYTQTWYTNTYKNLKNKYKNLTIDEFDNALKKVTATDPLYSQLEQLLVK